MPKLTMPGGTGGGGSSIPVVNGVAQIATAFPVAATGTTIACVGDSTTSGAGVTDTRQTYPAILSTMGSGYNANIVYNFGFTGFTTFSINAEFSTNNGTPTWTGGVLAVASNNTSMSAQAGAGKYAVILAGTNDYFGIYLTATLNGTTTISGLSTVNYITDFFGHARPIAVGDAVSGTGIPANTTVASIVSSSSLTLSNAATVSSSQLLTFTPSPTTSTFHTDLANLIANFKTAGSKVIVCTMPPANNTNTPANGVNSQGLFQTNRLVYNAYIRGLTFNGTGSNPDALLDLANLPQFTSFNAALFASDMLHENYQGNQVLAAGVNNSLLSYQTIAYYQTIGISESVPDTSLSANVALLNVANTFSGATQTMYKATGTVLQLQQPSTSGTGTALDLYSQFASARLNFNEGSHGYINGDPNGLIFNQVQGPLNVVHQQNASFIQLGNFFSPNMTSGQLCYLPVGHDHSTKNDLTLAFYFVGANSSANYATMGMYGISGPTVYGSGRGGLAGTGTLTDDGTSAWHVAMAGDIKADNGNLVLGTAGNTISIKGGTNAMSGTVTLASGVGTISSTAITTSTVVMLTRKTTSGTAVAPLTTVSAGSCAVAGSATDNGTYNWVALLVNQ